MTKRAYRVWAIWLVICLMLSACGPAASQPPASSTTEGKTEIPPFGGVAYVELEENTPTFTEQDKIAVSYEQYAQLDALGRCGVAMACVGRDLMPSEDRGSIGQVKPSGWHTVKYDCVDGKYLYNRCHLIGYQLTGENANVSNLITGTRYLNIEGMLPFENRVAEYVKETGNHVLYRVTPVFTGDNLLADGVVMEGFSVEDNGAGVSFHVFAYNVQPGVTIDYATGKSALAGQTVSTTGQTAAVTYILNVNSKKFHRPTCGLAEDIKPANRRETSDSRQVLVEAGYSPCGSCKP